MSERSPCLLERPFWALVIAIAAIPPLFIALALIGALIGAAIKAVVS